MKRVDESEHLSVHLPRVRLYRGDVENIIDILKKAGLKITIGDAEFVYDSLDELKAEKGPAVGYLQLKGIEEGSGVKGITLTLSNRENASLWLYGRHTSFEVCWHRLRDFLVSRRRWYYKVLNPWTAWILVLLAGLFGVTLKKLFPSLGDAAYIITYVSTLSYWLISLYWSRKYPVILLHRQHEHESFWRRNGDKIVLVIVSAVVGSAVTLAVKWLIGR